MESGLRGLYSVDHDALKAYFPLPTVVEGMFSIYQRMLSLQFTRVPDVSVYCCG
jgi:Zn-dependent oligopeptidase